MRFECDTSAFDGLEHDLRELEFATQKRVLRQALRKAGKPVLDDMKRRADARFKSHTGLLSESFRLSVRTDRKTGVLSVYMGVYTRRGEVRIAREKSNNPKKKQAHVYAFFLEYGTGPRELQSGAMHPGMWAQPFMRPAFDQNIEVALQRLSVEIRHGIDKALARQNRKKMKSWSSSNRTY